MTLESATAQPVPGDFIVYVDESGSPGLDKIDPSYPIFVLAFCIFEKAAYASQVVPEMLRLKFKHFGHDQVILHEHEIKKAKGRFAFLTNATLRADFMNDLDAMVANAPFTLIAVVIKKDLHSDRYSTPADPYKLAMQFGLERLKSFLHDHGQRGKLTHVVFECRGAREDRELELEFRRVAATLNGLGRSPMEIMMTDKKAMSTGLQLADLVARPIGLRVLRPSQPNRTWPTLEAKLRRSSSGQIDGYGLKVFP